MYRPQSGLSGRTLIALLVMGTVIGGVFYLYDNVLRSDNNNVGYDPAPVVALPTAVVTPVGTVAAPAAQLGMPMPADDAALFIPSVGVYAPVLTSILRGGTWDVSNLGMHVGYLQGTAWIGENDNIVLSGHVEMADGRKGVFADLDALAVGEVIVLVENEVEHRYIVSEIKRVDPGDLSVVYATTEERLTLITCSDYDFVRNTYDTRLVVVAERMQGA